MILEPTRISHFTCRLASLAGAALLALAGCASSSDVPISGVKRLPDELVIVRSDLSITPLTGLNSDRDDFGLTMPLDSTIVFFTSNRSGSVGKHSIYSARLRGSTWSTPALAITINNEQSNGMPSITPGGETMYFTGCDYGIGECDIYHVDVGPKGTIPDGTIAWSIPTNAGLEVNGSYWDSQAHFASDGGVLYFVSDRPGGFGGKDIWVARRGRSGAWEEAINAGELINTSFDEVTPWLSPDAQTLFFSSNGHPGLGGFDVFMATTTIGGTVVMNLGTPINSPANEISFSLSALGSQAFVASSRSGGMGGYDLYSIAPTPVQIDPLMVVTGTVTKENGKPLAATVAVTDLTSNVALGSFDTDPYTGRYAIVLPRGYNYALTAQAPGYLFRSQQVLVPSALEANATRTVDISLPPIGGAIRLLVFFPSGESNLERESVVDLNRAAAFLQANPTVHVEIAGHTDSDGDAKSNAALSQARAQAVKAYLVGNRIPADRITVKGYGASQPITSNETEEGKAMNRRIEMRVLPGEPGK